jgi:hypothetical protein
VITAIIVISYQRRKEMKKLVKVEEVEGEGMSEEEFKFTQESPWANREFTGSAGILQASMLQLEHYQKIG